MTSHKLFRNNFVKEAKMTIGSHRQPQREMLALFNTETFSSSTNHNEGGVRLASPVTRIISNAGFNYAKRVPCIRKRDPVALAAAGIADPRIFSPVPFPLGWWLFLELP